MKADNLTVAILAGGDSNRIGSYKAMADYRGKPLLAHMIEIGKKVSSNVLVVVSNSNQRQMAKQLDPDINVVVDTERTPRSTLSEAVVGFGNTSSDYTLLLPADSPKAKIDLLITLGQMKEGHGAVVPSWPNGSVEPLHSIYMSEHAHFSGLKALKTEFPHMQNFLSFLTNVIYVSTEVLKRFDPKLETFDRVNSPSNPGRLK
jgi:molybdopterin-guanine dinucleotide biosynthesis protein A